MLTFSEIEDSNPVIDFLNVCLAWYMLSTFQEIVPKQGEGSLEQINHEKDQHPGKRLRPCP